MPDLKRKRSLRPETQQEQTGQLPVPDQGRSDEELLLHPHREIPSEAITVAIFCALAYEAVAVKYSLDEEFTCRVRDIGRQKHVYSFGRLGNHKVVIAQPSQMGTVKAALCAATVSQQFPNVRFALMVGIGAGIPKIPIHDIHLGDIAVSVPREDHPGVIQYDLGKYEGEGRFVLKGSLNKPPSILPGADASLEEDEIMGRSPLMRILADITNRADYTRPTTEDLLFDEEFHHVRKGADCSECQASSDKKLVARGKRHKEEPKVHRGLILSGNGVIKNPYDRQHLLRKYGDAICYEMEAAGIMDEIPCLVIRGICDYADTHKQDEGHYYAAAVAAAYCKVVICRVDSEELEEASTMRNLLSEALREIRDEQSHIQDCVNEIGWKLDSAKLPIAGGAFFDSYTDQHAVACLPGTRTEILQIIKAWATDPNGKCIFWLNGMAGTGKSTISRTVARDFKEAKLLGASFFFKKGESDRGNAKRLFPTLRATDDDPFISEKALGEQFDRLLLQPLLKTSLAQTRTIIIVIDALDECESEDNKDTIRTLLQLLPRVQALKYLNVRYFITSRPDLPIRLGFEEIEGCYQDLDLHNIASSDVSNDIRLFLKDGLAQVQKDHRLSSSWPGERAIQLLLAKTQPLFISAATICRFIGDQNWNPQKRLEIILADQTVNAFSMGSLYLPILNQLLLGQDEWESQQLVQEFKKVVGVIVTLTSPLSVNALSLLLDVERTNISKRLARLHSVLNIPNSLYEPVRLLHLSFRDFLLSAKASQKFWIDEKATHQDLLEHCLRTMDNRLQKNICDLPGDGTQRSEVDMATINESLPRALQYACHHWPYHLKHSQDHVTGMDKAIEFLEKHFLHWFEALSILGSASEILVLIDVIRSVTQGAEDSGISEFLYDARRFIRQNGHIADIAPLQLYSSALVFAPRRSLIRRKFDKDLPIWLDELPKVAETWDADLQTLEHHQVWSLAVSPNGQLLASGSCNGTIRIWDTFSPDNRHLVSASSCGAIELRDTNIGILESSFRLPSHSQLFEPKFKFSPNITHFAIGSDTGLIELRDLATAVLQQTFKHSPHATRSMAFSPDSRRLASGSIDGTIKLWDLTTGALREIVNSPRVSSLIFSPQNQTLVSGSYDGIIRFWDTSTGVLHQTVKSYPYQIVSMAFAPDGHYLAIGFKATGKVQLWDSESGVLQKTLDGHSRGVTSLEFLPNSQALASGSDDGTIKIWDIRAEALQQPDGSEDHGRHTSSVYCTSLSPDGQLLASSSKDGIIKLCNLSTGNLHWTRACPSESVLALAFSPDGRLLASTGRQNMVNIWEITSGRLKKTFRARSDLIWAVVFSPNGQVLGSECDDGTITLWDITTEAETSFQQDEVERSIMRGGLAFSPDGQVLASFMTDRIRLRNITTGAVQETITALNMVGGLEMVSLTFLEDCLHVDSTWGSFRVNSKDYSSDSRATDTEVSLMEGQWVALRGEKTLWMPPDHRPSSFCIKGNTLVLGHHSGRISIIGFRP
ncbi:hypothetical protein BJY04DRAFT_220050 [Aspergillus karnatakaensis]|uniref:uncharacterized protein n=1 Tax=Aspergillus karnatakaensis TaxID=1810916 RepID=UPI003CCDA651